MASAGSIMRPADATGPLRPEDDLAMTELTAAQVLALSALAAGRPMTTAELARAVADMGMHLGGEHAAATVRSLTGGQLGQVPDHRTRPGVAHVPHLA